MTETLSVSAPRTTTAPCGHSEDIIRLVGTASVIGFCHRCQRGYEMGPVPA